jgi:hypothetical protein
MTNLPKALRTAFSAMAIISWMVTIINRTGQKAGYLRRTV